MKKITHHVHSASGVTLCAKVAGVERHIAKACEHWTGTPDEFRSWAERCVQSAFRGISSHCFCDTPDENIGVRTKGGV